MKDTIEAVQTGPCAASTVVAHCMSREMLANSDNKGASFSLGTRSRELFPLPQCSEVPRHAGLSISARRRRARVRQHVEQTNSIIQVLNEMYLPSRAGDFSSSGCCTAAQAAAQHEIYKAVAMTRPPSTVLSEREAVQELLHTGLAYDGGEVTTTVRPYERDLVSIPSCGHHAVRLDEVLDEGGRDIVKDPSRCMLWDADEWGEIVERQEHFSTYMDTKLKNDPVEYCSFVKDLYDSGMVEFTSKPQDLVTPFFVTKKNGRLRLVLDCRGVNRRFRPPPQLAMGSGASWAQLSVPKGSSLYVAQSDIKDYFYSLQLPEELRPLFSLPAVPAETLHRWQVPRSSWNGDEQGGWVFPMLRVVPMGWSWAMYVAHRAHQHQALIGSGLDVSRVLVDNQPAPDLSSGEPVLLPYADNLNVAGLDASRVQVVKDAAVRRLREVGFLVHEEMDACDEAQSLGFYINGREGYVAPVPDRLQRVILCFRWLSRRPSVSSKAVQRLVGHAVHFMLLNRGLLSTMRGLYDFIQRSGEGRKRLWKNAAREAAWISELLRVCIADLTKPWSQKISASDASLSGIAVCTRSCSEAEARDIGRVKESWRFKGRNPADRPRQILDEPGDPFSDVATVRPLPFVHEDPFELNLEFPEISQDFMAQSEWHLAFNQHMRFPEHITLLEGRGIVASLRHKARCIEAFGKKHLHINDNLGMVLAADKGRSSSMGILQVCRRLACLQIALGAQLVCRWVPSEWNVADKGSRRWEHLRRGHASSPTSRISAFKESEDSPQCSRSAKSSSSEAHRCQSSSSGARFETQEPSPGSEPAGGTNQAGESSEAGSTSTELCSLCSVSRADSLGTGGSVPPSCSGLPPESRGLPQLRAKPQNEPEEHDQVRQELMRVSQSFISRRLRPQRRNQVIRRSDGRIPRLFPEGDPHEIEARLAGMAQTGPGPHSASGAVAIDCSPGFANGRKRFVSQRSSRSYHVRGIPEARRGTGASCGRSGYAQSSTFKTHAKPSSTRAAGVLQNGCVRRKHHPRQYGDPQPGSIARNVLVQPRTEASARPGVFRTPGALGVRPEPCGTAKKPCRPLSAQALRAFSRSATQAEDPLRSQKEGTLGQRQLRQAIRGACQAQSGVPSAAQESTEDVHGSQLQLFNQGPKVFYPSPQEDKKIWVIELFSGCCRLSRAFAQHGYRALAYDIEYGSGCDLLDPLVIASLLRFVRSHTVKLVWMAMPCQSWSLARKGDGGPPPLRDDHLFLRGCPHLSDADQSKVSIGNSMLELTFSLAQHFTANDIDWVIENPWTSRCWLTQEFVALARAGARLLPVDYCQFNVPWRKSTGLLTSGFRTLDQCLKLCTPHCGRCSASGKRHLALMGRDSNGHWLTFRAQPYPRALCTAIASSMASSHSVGGLGGSCAGPTP